MRRTILIHTDALSREFPANFFLGKSLERAGWKVIHTSRFSTERVLRQTSPNAVLLSHVFLLEQGLLRDLRRRGTRVFVQEVEGTIRDALGVETNYPSDFNFELLDGLFVWNGWTRNWLIQNRQVSPDQIHVVGTVRDDLLPYLPKRQANGEMRIGFIGRFECINVFDDRHQFQLLPFVEKERLWRWHADLDVFMAYMEVMRGLAQRNAGISISIRPHPNENPASYEYLRGVFHDRIEVDRGFDLTEWLQSLDVIVGTCSSVFREAHQLGIPVVCTDRLVTLTGEGGVDEWRTAEYSACYLPATTEDAVQLILTADLVPLESLLLERFYRDFYGPRTDSTTTQIVETLQSANVGPARGAAVGPVARVVEIAVLVRRMTSKRRRSNLNYDYNSVLHRPSGSMQLLALKVAKGRSED